MSEKLPFAKRFDELIVYQRAYAVSLVVHKASLEFPKYEQYGGIADQMRRASKGICANIAEGHGKNHYPAEWRRFLMMALGSCQEMLVWCQYAVDLNYLPVPQTNRWKEEYHQMAMMIQGLLQKTKIPQREAA